jgi:predicted phosphodiesterase
MKKRQDAGREHGQHKKLDDRTTQLADSNRPHESAQAGEQALAALRAVQSDIDAAAPRKPKGNHPEGWEPGVILKGKQGTITARSAKGDPGVAFENLLAEWGFPPEQYRVKEDTIQIRTWDAAIGNGDTQRFWYYRADIEAIDPAKDGDHAALLQEIKGWKPRKGTQEAPGGAAMVVGVSDWQIGKEGTSATVERVLAAIPAVEAQWKALVKAGVPLDRLIVACLGDLLEGCDGNYGAQTFTVELDRRQQATVTRRLLTKCVTEWAKFAPKVIVAAVPGNHGEHRKNGDLFTRPGDNDDVAVVEQVAEITQANEALNHVSYLLPDQEVAVTLEAHGVVLGLTHGHHAKSGANAEARIESWWKGQTFGNRAAGDADVLLTGHYHYLAVVQRGVRTQIQAPALDSGSPWFADARGYAATAGVLTFTLSAAGWDHLKVLRPG